MVDVTQDLLGQAFQLPGSPSAPQKPPDPTSKPTAPGPHDVVETTTEELLGPLNEVERKNAPTRLFLAGDRELLRTVPRVSVIGTRRPTPAGRKRAEILCRALVEQRVVVVSGLAEGIDAIAHRTAIDAGGRTIAVLGTPLDRAYPKANAPLQDEIAARHLAVSEFSSGTPTRKSNFPRRNRTMALISHATVIVEAGRTSGTVHQGWEALRLGRPLFLLESLAKSANLGWPQEMLDYGARVLRREEIDSLFEVLPHGTLSAGLPF